MRSPPGGWRSRLATVRAEAAPAWVLALAVGCTPASSLPAQTPTSPTSPTSPTRVAPAREGAPLRSPATTATAFVQALLESPASADSHIDEAFVRVYEASGRAFSPSLPATLALVPEHCPATWRETAGGSDFAIAPPMEGDSPERVAQTEAILEGLRASTEVSLTCSKTVLIEDCHEFGCDLLDVQQDHAIFSIAVAPDGHGSWAVRGWRHLDTLTFDH